MSASSTPVYVASAGAVSRGDQPGGVPDRRQHPPGEPEHAALPAAAARASATAATPAAGPKVVRIQVPTDIGEVSLATRSMWWNRLGLPRSLTRKYALAPTAAEGTTGRPGAAPAAR